MDTITNQEVVNTLEKIAGLLEIKGENPFKIRAYRTAIDVVENMGEELRERLNNGGNLEGIPGFGEAIREKVTELIQTGKLEYLEKLEDEVPVSLLTIADLHGLGPKTTGRFWRELGVTTIPELDEAIKAGKLDNLERLGPKSIENIRNAVTDRLNNAKAERRPRAEVEGLVNGLLADLRALPEVSQVEVAGSYRRESPTVGDLDFLVSTTQPIEVLKAFSLFPQVESVLLRGDTKCSVIIDGLQVDCRAVSADSFGAAMQYFTGSKSHNIKVRGKALKLGLTINEYNVAKLDTGERVAGTTEEEVYKAIHMAWVPPTERKGEAEMEKYALPA